MARERRQSLRTDPAQSLDEVYRTMLTEPLRTDEELQKLYEPCINEARGKDLTEMIAAQLHRQHGGAWCKQFLYGSRGSGKSTEMSRLLEKVKEEFQGVRIDVRQELNPVAFQPHEILLAIAIAIAIVRETVVVIGDTEAEFDPEILQRVEDWFGETDYIVTQTKTRSKETKTKGGATLKLLKDFIEVGRTVTGTMQSNYNTKEETRFKRQARYAELRDAVNDLVAECTSLLGAVDNSEREWLIVIEDLDKETPLSVLSSLIYENAHIFSNLESHLICNLPLGLLSGRGSNLTGIEFKTMYDTPVYTADFGPEPLGRQSLQNALARRIDLNLFDEGQTERLIVASGGSLRDLFRMTARAADAAAFRQKRAGEPESSPGSINAVDVQSAINEERQEFRRALGDDLTGRSAVTWDEKKERLIAVYEGRDGHANPSAALNELLVVRAVQSFNGAGRLAVHPVVVDLMYDDHVFQNENNERPGGLI